MGRKPLLLLILLLMGSGLSLTLLSQTRQQPPKDNDPFQIKVNVDLVQLAVTVNDKNGLAVAGLNKENFQVLEDKVPQEISLFKHEDIPLSMGLVIDNSGSMRNKRERVHSAALTFVRESNPDDETFMIAFHEEAYLEQDFSGSIGDLVDALDNLDPRNGTALHDAIYLGMDHVKKGRLEKKAILVISDGEDKDSKMSYDKLLKYVQGSKNIAVYAIGLMDEAEQGTGFLGLGRSTQKKAQQALSELVAITGGRAYFPKSLDEVEVICRQLARELRDQYTIGYYPKNEKRDGTQRQVTVNVVNPPRNAGKLTVHAPTSYVAPGGSAQ
jgi:Ca-activated chloride channel family protein